MREALTGHYRREHVFALRQALELYDSYQERIEACDQEIKATLEALQDDDISLEALPAARHKTRQANEPKCAVSEVFFRVLGTDRGSQYASHAYRDRLRVHGTICSMSGKGDCLDNAVAERCFGSVKRERTSHQYYETRQEARDDVIDYIEMFYNSTRKHSYLGYLSPNAYEKMPRTA